MNKQDIIYLDGDLIFSTVASKRKSFLAAIHDISTKKVVVDLTKVVQADSSALSLMLEGIRTAKRSGKFLQYQGTPNYLLKLAMFCRVDGILTI